MTLAVDFPKRARRFAGAIKRSPRHAARALRGAMLRAAIERDWASGKRPTQRPHDLPGELIVSLTSYRPRFATLAPTLKCLLTQSVKPNRLVLWLSDADAAHVPPEITELCAHGLAIAHTRDLRSYNKIVPTLRAAPCAFVVTADDDLYYPPTWLEELTQAYRRQSEIVCHRAHAIQLIDGRPAPYLHWSHDDPSLDVSPLLFPTGCGGVLYPPGALHEDVLDEKSFTTLCPYADDVWLYFMGRRAGTVYRRVGPRRDMISWPGSQHVALLKYNVAETHGNDEQIARLIDRYGFPAPR